MARTDGKLRKISARSAWSAVTCAAFSKVADWLVFRYAAIQNSFENGQEAQSLLFGHCVAWIVRNPGYRERPSRLATGKIRWQPM